MLVICQLPLLIPLHQVGSPCSHALLIAVFKSLSNIRLTYIPSFVEFAFNPGTSLIKLSLKCELLILLCRVTPILGNLSVYIFTRLLKASVLANFTNSFRSSNNVDALRTPLSPCWE